MKTFAFVVAFFAVLAIASATEISSVSDLGSTATCELCVGTSFHNTHPHTHTTKKRKCLPSVGRVFFFWGISNTSTFMLRACDLFFYPSLSLPHPPHSSSPPSILSRHPTPPFNHHSSLLETTSQPTLFFFLFLPAFCWFS